MNTREQQDRLYKVTSSIYTWEDAYDWFDDVVKASVAIGHPSVVYGSLFLLHSFLQSMREQPDEGDIRKLIERTIRLLIYEEQENFSTGFQAFFGPEPTKEQQDSAKTAFDELMSVLRNAK